MSKKRRIAVTGGIGTGKSTVCGMLADLGLSVVSADAITAELWSNPEVLEKIARGLEFSQTPTREAVRSMILRKPEKRKALNAILHPMILQSLDLLNADVIEAPLLIETCIQHRFDSIWVVVCQEEEQLRRIQLRGISFDEARRLMSTQLPLTAKTPFADVIVRTDVPMSDVNTFVSQALSELQRN